MTEIDISLLHKVLSIAHSTSLNLIKTHNELQQQFSSTETQFNQISDTISNCNSRIESLRGDISNIDTQLTTGISDIQDSQQTLVDRITNINDGIQSLQRKLIANIHNYEVVVSNDPSEIPPIDPPIDPPVDPGGETPSTPGGETPTPTPTPTPGTPTQDVDISKIHWFFINAGDNNIKSPKSMKGLRDRLLQIERGGQRLVTDDEDRMVWINGGTNQIKKGKSARENRQNFYEYMRLKIQRVPEDGLFTFIYNGHGGGTFGKGDFYSGKTIHQQMAVYGGLIDQDIWEIFKLCKGRIFAIFNCCFAGTMYGYQVRDTQTQISGPIFPFGKYMVSTNQNNDIPEIVPSSRTAATPQPPEPNIFEFATDNDKFKQITGASSYFNAYMKNKPVYVKLSTRDVRMCSFSGSPEQTYGYSQPGKAVPATFYQSLIKALDSCPTTATYQDIFNATYVDHYRKPWTTGGTKRIRASLCTYTDGFNPADFTFLQ